MNDVMAVIEIGCTAFMKIAVGVALLSFARAALAFTAKKTQTTVTTSTGGQSPAWKAPTVAPTPTPDVASVPSGADIGKRMEEIAEVLQDRKLVPAPEELIECGVCHNVIQSAPLLMGHGYAIYNCEHCHARLEVQP